MKITYHSIDLLAVLHATLDVAKAREAKYLAKLEAEELMDKELEEARLDTEYIRALYREATAYKDGVTYAYTQARRYLPGEAIVKHDANLEVQRPS